MVYLLNPIRSRFALAAAMLLIGADSVCAMPAHAAPGPTPKTMAAHPKPHVPAPIRHAPGATNLDPGLNTNPDNDPTPGAFQFGTGTDPFNGETGEGSGPEGSRRTAAIHDAYAQIAAVKRPAAAATPIPPGKLKPARTKTAPAAAKK